MTDPTNPAASTTSAPPGSLRRSWMALAVLLVGAFMSLLDATIVNVALPSIRSSIDASESTLSWIISGYALAFGLALIPAGRIGDRFGHKWVFFTGLALFTAASVACGLAQDDTQLVVARVVQGLAGGIYLPAVTAFIQLLFPGRVRGKAFAILGAVIGVSAALGPLVGGVIIQAFGEDAGWRLVFGVNLPIGVIALIATAVLLPRGRENDRPVSTGVDIIGLVLLSAGLVAILVPLIDGQDQDWPLWTYISMAAGVVIIVLFALWELSVARRNKNPLVPPHLYSHAAFTGGTILALVYFAAFTSIFFSLSILWQTGLGYTALETGLVTLPFALGSIVGASQSDRLSSALGRGVLVTGVGMVTIGLGALWLVLLLVPASDLTGWTVLMPLLIAGVGSGLFIAPNAQFIVATVDRHEAGAASGVINTMQRLGSAIGVAVVGSVFFGTLVLPEDRPTAADIATSFSHSAAAGLGVSAGFALLAFALVFTLPRRIDRGYDIAEKSSSSAR
jgi:EmrB/QacA subfamily drug resistance transporter